MKDPSKTKQELIEELSVLKQRLQELEHSESDRKQAEEELLKSEENFRRSLDDSSLGVRISTSGAETIYVNQAMLDIYGYDSVEEMKRMPVKERYAPQSYAEYKIRKEKRERGELDPSQYEISIVRKNGEVRHLQAFRKEILWNGVKQAQIIYQDITGRKQAEAKLRQQTDAMETAIDGMAILNEEGKYVYLNKAHVKVYGYENAGELIGKSWSILYDSDVLQRFEQEIMPEFSQKGDWHGETIGTKKNGSKFPQEISLTAMANGGLICVVQDITKRKQMEETIRYSEQRYRTILDEMADGYFELDLAGNYTFVNDADCRHLGYSREELIGANFRGQMAKEDIEILYNAFSNIYITGKPARGISYRAIRKDGITGFAEVAGFPLQNQKGEIIGFRGIARDITERKQTEEKIRQMAYHDSLTGLPNRKLFYDRLGIALAQAQRNQKKVGIVMLDLDNFKGVNDTLGHDVGDLLLQATAERLSAALRKSDTVARIGGDEFVLILPDLEVIEDAIPVAQKIVDSFYKPFLIDTHQLVVTMSIGIAVYPHDGTDEGILLKNADIAMYQAKQAGGGRYQLCKKA
jgi:diguanylate cyclase (GGDEF)-like protein/PAS domain S-box-containing protein